MADKITIIIHTERGEQTIVVDARVAGCLADGAFDAYEALYDGHGKLLNSRSEGVAGDLAKAGDVLRSVFNEVVYQAPQPPQKP
ncbi:hypothetical protein A2210_00820 [Candidatus Woesebacteria bacterium RIFOXYA1_FULL_40_18]|uniref:DUF2997 domain-containing protein n=2 Tax=Candidatus Woeseibacteriota TaxID=1752722 RepID=A0A1F8CJI5_9BACT|nr:MAG: hypothetical protein A2210_00820 [Candidatus Woesebacteria bacterium RIFOXYA1_FULL_40_18]OGM80342.1 MAG: hypothetical protein A2361_02825 [Candidatus Woesebacteria bacterium RIFOXYB1_FULL_40_26]